MAAGRGFGRRIPATTARAAWSSNPEGTPTTRIRDRLGGQFTDEDFEDWFPANGHPGLSPAVLALVFSDGTALRNLGATDQNGDRLHPAGQCGHLALNQWNQITAKIGAIAAGKTPLRIDLGYDQPGSNGSYRGYVDDISLTG